MYCLSWSYSYRPTFFFTSHMWWRNQYREHGNNRKQWKCNLKVTAPYLTLPCWCLIFCICLCFRVKVNTHLLKSWKTLSLLPFLLKVTLLNVIWNWEHFKLENDDHCNKEAPVHPWPTMIKYCLPPLKCT